MSSPAGRRNLQRVSAVPAYPNEAHSTVSGNRKPVSTEARNFFSGSFTSLQHRRSRRHFYFYSVNPSFGMLHSTPPPERQRSLRSSIRCSISSLSEANRPRRGVASTDRCSSICLVTSHKGQFPRPLLHPLPCALKCATSTAAFPTRGALATTFMLIEIRNACDSLYNISGLVHYDDCGRSKTGLRGNKRIKSMIKFANGFRSRGTELPPGITAFRLSQPQHLRRVSINSRSGIDNASSTTQGFSTWPEMQKILVP